MPTFQKFFSNPYPPLLLSAAIASIGMPAQAALECGSAALVNCQAAGNPYPDGIIYVYDPLDPVMMTRTIVFEPGVAVDTTTSGATGLVLENTGPLSVDTTAGTITAGGSGIIVSDTSNGGVTIKTGDVTSNPLAVGIYSGVSGRSQGTVSIDTTAGAVSAQGTQVLGVIANGDLGAVISTADVTVNAESDAVGIGAVSLEGATKVDSTKGTVNVTSTGETTEVIVAGIYTIGMNGVNVSSADVNVSGVVALGVLGSSNEQTVIDTTAGAITTSGDLSYGVVGGGRTSTSITTGDVTVNAAEGGGVMAFATEGAATINTSAGHVSVTTGYGYGILADGVTGAQVTSGDVTVNGVGVAGIVATSLEGPASVDSTAGTVTVTGEGETVGIFADSLISAQVKSGNVTVTGPGATGIKATSAEGYVAVDSTAGIVSVQGDNTTGIRADGAAGATVTSGNVTVTGLSVQGINASSAAGAVLVNSSAGTIQVQSPEWGATGISANGLTGTSVIAGNIAVTGGGATGISAISWEGKVEVDSTAGTITAQGYNATGITSGGNDISIASGNISVSGDRAEGIAASTGGLLNINTTAGTITAQGDWNARGISAAAANMNVATGNISVSTEAGYGVGMYHWGEYDPETGAAQPSNVVYDGTAGPISTQGDHTPGVFYDREGRADSPGMMTATLGTGAITTSGVSSHGAYALNADALTINSTGGAITTTGDQAASIFALSTSERSDTQVTAGPVNVSGTGSIGVAVAALSNVDMTYDEVTEAMVLIDPLPAGSVRVATTAPIQATGADGAGVVALSWNAPGFEAGNVNVDINAPVTASGQNGAGVSASSSIGIVTVNNTSTITGGWSANLADLSATQSGNVLGNPAPGAIGSNLPAAGVVLFSGAVSTQSNPGAILNNSGTITAWNDRAITMGYPYANVIRSGGGSRMAVAPGATDPALNPPLQTGSVQINNTNTVIGFITLWPAPNGHVFNNAGTFQVRHYADGNGDGVRETKAVSVSDYGGVGSTFNNTGTVNFGHHPQELITNRTGYLVPTTGPDSRPLEASFYELGRSGIQQGQFVNLATFNNAGVIDLRGPATGNTLVLTGDPVATGQGVRQGMFVANGGQLLLNTQLNSGIPLAGQTNSYSDMLIVDRTSLGSAPTSIMVSNRDGLGEYTPGNGIEVVEVRNKAPGASAPGVFTLGNRVAAGAYEYSLFHNGVAADAADGNWYLRNTLIVPPVPVPPVPGQPAQPAPPPQIVPDYRVEVPTYMAAPGLAFLGNLASIGRYSDRRAADPVSVAPAPAPQPEPVPVAAPAPVKPQTIWCKNKAKNYRCTPTPEQEKIYADTIVKAPVQRAAPAPAPVVQPDGRHLAWARLYGDTGKIDRLDPGSTAAHVDEFRRRGPDFDYHTVGVQAGVDLYRSAGRNPSDVAGVFVGGSNSRAKVEHIYGGRAGTVDLNGFSLGGYWTRTSDSGWYLDNVIQATRLSGKAKSVRGQQVDLRGWVLSASAEVGKSFPITQNLSIEPQAQLILAHGKMNDGRDDFGKVAYDDWTSLTGRVGARLTRDWGQGTSRKGKAWVSTDLVHTFNSNAKTTFSTLNNQAPVDFRTQLGGTAVQVGAGVSAQLSRNTSAYATVGYSHGLGNDNRAVSGRVGISYRW